MIDIVCQRDEEGHATVNIPQLVMKHSTTGFDWGYDGSGPSDLALNILELALHSIHWNGPREKCWRGSCYERASIWHQDFKRKFIAPMDKQGGVISGREVIEWLSTHD